MPRGTIKWFDTDKGYGFILQDGGGPDVFLHTSEVAPGGLDDGRHVEFEIGEGSRGPVATGVRVL